MQRGFLSLLDNMAEMLKSVSGSSAIRKHGGVSERRQEYMLDPYGNDGLDYRNNEVDAK